MGSLGIVVFPQCRKRGILWLTLMLITALQSWMRLSILPVIYFGLPTLLRLLVAPPQLNLEQRSSTPAVQRTPRGWRRVVSESLCWRANPTWSVGGRWPIWTSSRSAEIAPKASFGMPFGMGETTKHEMMSLCSGSRSSGMAI